MVLRDSQYRGDATFETVLDLATTGLDNDESGRRKKFISLVQSARSVVGGTR